MDVEEKVEELASRVDKLEKENEKLKEENRDLKKSVGEYRNSSTENKFSSNDISRRKFMKMLGLGASGLALSSAATGLTWSKITPQTQGTSDIQAETAIKGVTNGSSFNIEDTTNNTNLLEAGEAGPFDLSKTAQNLRIATGQAIEDDSRTDRISLTSGETRILDEAGEPRLRANSSAHLRLDAEVDSPVKIADQEGNFDAVQYFTSSTAPGTLELTNADLDLNNNGLKYFTRVLSKVLDNGEYVSIDTTSTKNAVEIQARDSNENWKDNIAIFRHGGQVELPNGNLRLATGQNIEDGSGNNRLTVGGDYSLVNYENGETGIEIRSGIGIRNHILDGAFWDIRDEKDNSFSAVRYLPRSSSPGTFELTNANLDVRKNVIQGDEGLRLKPDADYDGTYSVEIQDSQGQASLWLSETGELQWTIQDGSTRPKINNNDNGELVASDDEGNSTTLT